MATQLSNQNESFPLKSTSGLEVVNALERFENLNSFEGLDFLCFSHLRWDFVFQRPQHLLTRLAKLTRVFYIEEAICEDIRRPFLNKVNKDDQLWVVTPHLPKIFNEDQKKLTTRKLIDELLKNQEIKDYISWYYTPMALPISRHLEPIQIVYDCMDELSHFKGAPAELVVLEDELLDQADIVFTGGFSLFEAKKNRHPNIFPFPSSIEFDHFAKARKLKRDPIDQAPIPSPRLGFYGVIDERMNIHLLDQVADLRPDWHWVMIGPVVKIDPQSLPKKPNIHYLGGKSYQELPQYLAGWDCAILPFAKNDATKYISPTKTPEYLAAGKPVVSTSIRDVVRPYGKNGLVKIADTPLDFVGEAELAMAERRNDPLWMKRVDQFLASTSWDRTFHSMVQLIARDL